MYHGFAGNGGPTLLCPLGVFDLKRFELSCCYSFAFPFCFLSQAVEGACAWPAAARRRGAIPVAHVTRRTRAGKTGQAAPGRWDACAQQHLQAAALGLSARGRPGLRNSRTRQPAAAAAPSSVYGRKIWEAGAPLATSKRQAPHTRCSRKFPTSSFICTCVCSWLYCRPTAARVCVEHQQA